MKYNFSFLMTFVNKPQKIIMTNRLIITIYAIVFSTLLFSQSVDTTDISRDQALNIYIDCHRCDQQYFKEHFTIVNYVRDRKESDVHIIITEMRTGSGGTEYSLQFIGRNEFITLVDTLTFSLPPDETEDEERTSLLKSIQFGLVPYILKTPYADKLVLSIDSDEEIEEEVDPWKNWVFRVSANGWGRVEKSYTSFDIYSGVNIQKVTPDIKIELNAYINYDESKYRLYEDDSLVYSNDTYQSSYRFSSLLTKSIGDHWGVGGFFNIRNSTYQNLELKVNLNPAIEYNVFSYEDASSKQLRFLYSVGYSHFNYIDTTIYDKTAEGLFNQELRIMFKYVDDWGSIDASLMGSNYLNDFSLYYLSAFIGTEIRIVKGLSFDLYSGIDIPRNQIGLRKEATTAEDVLTRQHEMLTNYNLFANVGLSYTFGSIYNNVVNPRFQ